MSFAILIAVGAPRALAAAKQREYIGLDFEFRKINPPATPAKLVRSRWLINQISILSFVRGSARVSRGRSTGLRLIYWI
ncbi:MAG TPA: hypothetical protein VIY49_20775 [Bryobacteraceae bacterium]